MLWKYAGSTVRRPFTIKLGLPEFLTTSLTGALYLLTGLYVLKKHSVFLKWASHVNLFIPNASFLYPMKTWKNRKIFWCLQGVEKWCIGNQWVNVNIRFFHAEAASKRCSAKKVPLKSSHNSQEKRLFFSKVAEPQRNF